MDIFNYFYPVFIPLELSCTKGLVSYYMPRSPKCKFIAPHLSSVNKICLYFLICYYPNDKGVTNFIEKILRSLLTFEIIFNVFIFQSWTFAVDQCFLQRSWEMLWRVWAQMRGHWLGLLSLDLRYIVIDPWW